VRRLAALSLLGACAAQPAPPPADPFADAAAPPPSPADAGLLGPPWALVWSDDFDGAAGARPDPARWTAEVGGDGWGNGQLEFDTDRTENASLDGQGHLAIVARREDYGGRAYTSARLVTRGQFAQSYGRFEARMHLARGQGLWPAFWLLGGDLANVGWPACGEIDVMEHRGQEPTRIRGSLHGPGHSGGGNHGRSWDAGLDLTAGFHVFAVEWDPGRVVWKVDDQVFFTATPADLPDGAAWVYDHPFFMILNLAVGGGFVGDPDGSTGFPTTLLIDWVRVYERQP
jgi:beta-glucanase (GH16 family)